MRASHRRALGILFLALVLTISLSASESVYAQQGTTTNPGACFLLPEGTNWSIFTYPGGYTYHNGCENGGSCGSIMGYDYMADRGVPVLAPFSGIVTRASQSVGGSPTICSDTDGVGNSVFIMVDETSGIEFGMLHSTCDSGFKVGDQVQVGQLIGTISDIGQASGTHAHVWFKDLGTGDNIPDHDRYWQCVSGTPPVGGFDQKLLQGSGALGQQNSGEIITFLDLLAKAIQAPLMPAPAKESEKYEFYISHQHSDLNYQYNFVAFFAGHGLSDPTVVEQKAMEQTFEGYWEIPKGGSHSVQEEFGWGCYTDQQGMRIAPGANGDDYGNGACNDVSVLHYVLAESGLQVDADKNTHPPVSGVPEQYLTTVYCPGTDVRITNPYDHPVRLHWLREGDRITLWVEHVGGLRVKLSNAKEDLEQLQALYDLVEFLAEVDWGRIGATLLAVLVLLLLLWLWIKVFKLKLRALMIALAIPMILYTWLLPNNQAWKSSPFDGEAEITQYYGDPRRDPEGYTGLSYQVTQTTSVVAVVSGRVITPNNSNFKENQVWVEVGNGLFIQYSGLTSIAAESGDWIRAGKEIGVISSETELRFGISSKHPDDFYDTDERGFGWINPEEYLGQDVLSGRRQEESVWTVLGWSLLFLAICWPNRWTKLLVKAIGTDFKFPWDEKRLFHNGMWLVLSTGIYLLGKYLVCPFLIELAKPIVLITGLYLFSREIYRYKVRKGTDQDPGFIHYAAYVLLTVFWIVRSLVMISGAVANPSIAYAARGDLMLDLPKVILPSLPLPEEAPPWLSDQPSNSDSSIIGWDYEWSSGSSLPEFTTTYWTGSPVRFYAPPELWAAINRQAPKYPTCDPRLILIVAQSESPNYTNHVSENYATAAGTWQFIRSTWEWMMPGVSLEKRTDLDLSAEAAFKYLDLAGVCSATTESELVNAFAYDAPVWNQHEGQARFVWRAYSELRKQMGE